MKSRFVVLPAISHLDQLADVLARVAFHFHFIEPDSVTLLVNEGLMDDATRFQAAFVVPDGMDPLILRHYDSLKEKVRIVADGSEDPQATLLVADHVLVWDLDALEDPNWKDLLDQPDVKGRTVHVDKHRTQHEGLRYIELASRIYTDRKADLKRSRERFHVFADSLGHVERAYLLGTGPSIDRFAEFDFSDGLVVACNTTILDEELMEHAKPRVVTFADPIFHFGVSDYAASYRSALTRVAKKHKTLIVIPLRDYPLFAALMPDLESQAVGVPVVSRISPNVDLLASFQVRPTNNILTLLMLPVAASLAQEVLLLGFDGRTPDETYFWQHSEKTQFHEKLQRIKDTHPAFFELSYEDYYDRHTGDVERYALTAERNGSRVVSLVDSHVPALKRRRIAAGDPPLNSLTSNRSVHYRVISIAPDWVDEMGHHAHFERTMRDAIEADGGTMISLTSRALVPEDPDREVPVFTHSSYGFDTNRSGVFVRTFRDELLSTLGRLTEAEPKVATLVMMYTAGLAHLPAIVEVASRLQDRSISFHINLLRANSDILTQRGEVAGSGTLAAYLLSEAIELGGALDVYLYADTDELNAAIESLTGFRVGVWPMVGVTPLDPTATITRGQSVGSETMSLYYPGTQISKGYDIFAGLTELMESEAPALGLGFVARDAGPRPDIASKMRDVGVHLVDGVLSDAEYAGTFQAADIIALPYREVPFLMQTSGVLADAIRLGKPVVATRTTWAGRLADAFKLGTTFTDGDVHDFRRAVREMIAGYPAFRSNMQAFAPTWLEANNPTALLDTLIAKSREQRAVVVDLDRRVSALSKILDIANNTTMDESRRHAEAAGALDSLIVDRDEKIEAQSRLLDEFRRVVKHLEIRIEITRADRDQRLASLKAQAEKRDEELRAKLADKSKQVEALSRSLTNRVWRALKARLRG